MNIFEIAARKAYRFDSQSGFLNVEQLWQLPLVARDRQADINGIAIATQRALKETDEESFVTVTPNPLKKELETKLEILKHIRDAKLADQAASAKAAENAERKQKILEILARKQDAALEGKTEEELLAELQTIG